MSDKTNNSLSAILKEAQQLYNYAAKYNGLIKRAMTTESEVVRDNFTNPTNGQTEEITFVSFASIKRRMDEFAKTIHGLTNVSDGEMYAELQATTNSIRTLWSVNYGSTPTRMSSMSDIKIERAELNPTASPLSQVNFPYTTSQIDLTNKVQAHVSKVNTNIITILDEISSIEFKKLVNTIDNMNLSNVINVLKSNRVRFDSQTKVFDMQPDTKRLFGEFSVLTTKGDGDGNYIIGIDTLKFHDISSVSPFSRELAVGHKLTNETADTLFEVIEINKSYKQIILKRIAGMSSLIASASALKFVDVDVNKIINYPIGYKTKQIVFVSPIHPVYNTSIFFDEFFTLDSSDMTIDINGVNTPLEAYLLSKNAVSISDYLEGLMTDTPPPSKFSKKPNTPALSSGLFKVVQVNKHLQEHRDIKQIRGLVAEKSALKQAWNKSMEKVSKVRNENSSMNFTSRQHKISRERMLDNAISKSDSNRMIYKGTIEKLSDVALNRDGNNVKPKYQVRGFIPEITVDGSKNQGIVKYDIEYRYVSQSGNVAQPDTIKGTNNNGSVVHSGTFSPWVAIPTKIRNRIKDVDGNVVFESENNNDADLVNFNQLSISITFGEQVEIRCRAISEVGYPNVITASDWSEIVSVEFPSEMSEIADLGAVEREIRDEMAHIEMDAKLSEKGISTHTNSQFFEQNVFFAHWLKDISSGFVSDEQRNISAFDYINGLTNRVSTLEARLLNANTQLDISIVDDKGNKFAVERGGTTSIFAGYYADSVEGLGDILTKQYYINIKNNSSEPFGIHSINAGSDGAIQGSDALYGKAPIGFITDGANSDAAELHEAKRQLSSAILYLRNRNVANNYDLFDDSLSSVSGNYSSVAQFDVASTIDDAPYKTARIKYMSSGVTSIAKYWNTPDNGSDTEGVLVSNDHPSSTTAIADFTSRLAGLRLTGDIQKGIGVNNGATENVMFKTDDKYMIGKQSCGSLLFMNPSTPKSISTAGTSPLSTKQIAAGETLVIGFVFQLRMADYLGGIMGVHPITSGTQNTSTNKTLGFDILINGSVFSFDVNLTAKYTATSFSANDLPIIGDFVNTNYIAMEVATQQTN